MKLENKKEKTNKEQEQKRKNKNQKHNPKYNKSDTPISGSEVSMDLAVFLVYYTKQNIHVYSLICFSTLEKRNQLI